MKQGKDWGYTTAFFKNDSVSAYHLEINKGGFCSEHRHKFKFNKFYVISGRLEITIWRKNEKKDITVIGPGQPTVVPPGVWHQFRGLEDTQCIEVYTVLLREPDIDRRTEGGMETENAS